MAPWSGQQARPSGRRNDAFRLRSEGADKLADLMSGRLMRDDGMARGTLTPEKRMDALRRGIEECDAIMADLRRAGLDVPQELRKRRNGMVARFASIGADGYAGDAE